MLLLIVTFIFGAFLAFFATQNTNLVAISYMGYTWQEIPLYLIVIGSILVGLVLAGVISVINSFTNTFTLMGKDKKIKESSKEVIELRKKVEDLETENSRLRVERKESL